MIRVWQWTLASVAGLAVGLPVGLALGVHLEIIVGMVLVTPIMTAIVGTVLGSSQWLVLRRHLTRVGMVSSTISGQTLAQRLLLALLAGVAACGGRSDGTVAFVGARVIDGTGRSPIEDAVMLVMDGRVTGVGDASATRVPEGADRVDLSGRTVVPGFINTHGHVGATAAADSGDALDLRLRGELATYAQYGVTTVVSLGGDRLETIRLRDDTSARSSGLARIYVAGEVVTGDTPEAAVAAVDRNAAMNVDFIKIRVDDNLGTVAKMRPDVYRAVVARAHEHGLRLAAHVFYVDDAKDVLRAGADFLAHSVRDRPVDDEFLDLLTETDVCYCPTLTREVSTFVYERTPDFFDDPFFQIAADTDVVRALSDPARQERVRSSASAQRYKVALDVASANVKRVADGGGTIAFGTDTGPFGRFQGYFEHLEMDLLANAGLTPMQILVAATGDAARCLGLRDVGTLAVGYWADFVVLTEDPLTDIANTRSIESVWIGGVRAR